jgi:hypothetical protein
MKATSASPLPWTRRDLIIAGGIGVLFLAVYLRTAAPSLLAEGDGIELAMVSYLLGIAHPTGYPLFTLLGYLFTHLLPWDTVAGRLGVMSALFSAAAVGAVFALARQLRVDRFGALLAALTFGLGQAAWTVATRGDVHGLNALLMALSTLLLVRWAQEQEKSRGPAAGEPEGWRRAAPLLVACAFVCGLSLTNHITTYLLAPAFVVYFLLTGKPFWTSPRRLVRPVLALLAPLSLYAYIPLRGSQLLADPALAADPAGVGIPLRVAWGLVSPHYKSGGWDGFVNLVLGLDYAPGMLSVPWSEAPARLAGLPTLLAQQLGPAGLILSLLGLLLLARRQPREAVLLGVILVTFSAQVTRATEQSMAVFLIPAYLVLALTLGLAGSTAVSLAGRWLPGAGEGAARALAGGALMLMPLSLLVANFPVVDRSGDRSVDQFTQALLDGNPPQGAVLLGAGDFVTPIRYRQMIDGQRPDLVPVHVGFGTPRVLELLDICRAQGRAAYMLEVLPEPERDASSGRFAVKITPALVERGRRPQFAAYTNMGGQAALLGYDLPAESVRAGELFRVRLYWQALQPLAADYDFFVRLISPDSRIANQVDRRPVSDWLPTSQWFVGAALADDVRVPIPANTAPGVYNLEVAWTLGESMLPLVRQTGTEDGPIVLRQITIVP